MNFSKNPRVMSCNVSRTPPNTLAALYSVAVMRHAESNLVSPEPQSTQYCRPVNPYPNGHAHACLLRPDHPSIGLFSSSSPDQLPEARADQQVDLLDVLTIHPFVTIPTESHGGLIPTGSFI